MGIRQGDLPGIFNAIEHSTAQQSTNSAQLGAAKAAAAQAQQDKLALLLRGHQLDEEGATNRLSQASDYVDANPHMGVSVSKEGASITPKDPKDNSLGLLRLDNQQERLRQNLITKVKGDYDKVSGPATKRMAAAQSVIEALNRGDITTLGRIKAQLPVLEGENYKPTDAEREIMLQPTAEGVADKLKNYLGGDNVGASQAQLGALRKFVQDSINREKEGLGRNRKEVLMRYKTNVRALSPDQMDSLAGTLGMSNEELIGHLQDRAAPGSMAPGAPAPAQAGGGLSPAAEARRQELLKKAGR